MLPNIEDRSYDTSKKIPKYIKLPPVKVVGVELGGLTCNNLRMTGSLLEPNTTSMGFWLRGPVGSAWILRLIAF